MANNVTESLQAAEEDEDDAPLVLGQEGAVHRSFTVKIGCILVITLTVFTAAFVRLERWSVCDAAYFVCSTAATIGFGDLRPVGRAGRALTCLLGCCGVGLLGTLVSAMLESKLFGDQRKPKSTGIAAFWNRLGLWAKAGINFSALMLFGVLGLRLCEPTAVRPSFFAAAYMVAGTLTTAGLGDVVPVSRAAKSFIALYSVAGTIAFSQVVGRIALQPLIQERRASQREVLASYGSELTEDTLAVLARGPLVKRLGLSESDNFCSRKSLSRARGSLLCAPSHVCAFAVRTLWACRRRVQPSVARAARKDQRGGPA